MKKIILFSFMACCLLMACHSTKKTTTATASTVDTAKLAGTWQLNYVSGSAMPIDSLYPNKKPTITFNLAAKHVSGNSGCNAFNGPLNVSGNKINFSSPMASTRMFCPGKGENVFFENLKKVNTWSVHDNTLTFIMGDIAIMRFEKK